MVHRRASEAVSITAPTCSRKFALVGLQVTDMETVGVQRGDTERPVPWMPLAVIRQRATL
jgi:hypothetical protein